MLESTLEGHTFDIRFSLTKELLIALSQCGSSDWFAVVAFLVMWIPRWRKPDGYSCRKWYKRLF